VWWTELQKGNDAIKCIEEATPELIAEVLLSQMRSIYLKEFPPAVAACVPMRPSC
jgi:hypothetical protein